MQFVQVGPEMNRSEMLDEMMQYGFATHETALYLDTHPNDCRVLERHNYFAEKFAELKRCYSETFNEPLTNMETAQGYWTYINEPWPWEKCYYDRED